jgi:hypothetical protein
LRNGDQVQAVLEAYLAGELALDDLQLALVKHTWDAAAPPPLAVEAEFLIGEATSGHLTADDLNAELRTAVQESAERLRRERAAES